MKKWIALLLALLCALCITGCGKTFGTIIVSVQHTNTDGVKTMFQPSESAQTELLSILNNGKWFDGTPNCLHEYEITLQGKTLFYHAECGTVYDVAAKQSLALSKEEQVTVNRALGIAEDFSFSLTWNCYGVSSYDSKSGLLVKTTDAPDPENFITTHELSADDHAFCKELIDILDVYAYPDEYDPQNGFSEPSMTLILIVDQYGVTKTIAAENIALTYESTDPKGQAFLRTCETISTKLMETEAWASLPEFAYLYE